MYSELQKKLADGYILRERYKIIRLLSDSTGFGITYLAEDLDLPNNHKCVVKQLKLNNSKPEVVRIATRLFKDESNHLYRLGKHDQIPRLYARFQENNEFYLVQEYIKGKDLFSEIIPGRLWDESETIKYLKEILEVLDFVHQKNIIHRDIKPDNIIRRDHDGKLVLIDFGAVKEINTTTVDIQGQERKTVCIGPLSYMPIEQHQGKPVLASDIYLVGVTCIWGLTGTHCIDGWRNRNNIRVSHNLATIINKMIDDKWQNRYQNAHEALTAINQMNSDTHMTTISEKFWNWFNNG